MWRCFSPYHQLPLQVSEVFVVSVEMVQAQLLCWGNCNTIHLAEQQAVYSWARHLQKHHKGAYESYKVILLQVAGKTQRSPGTMEILRAQKCLREKCVLWPFPQVLEFSKEESPRSLLIYWKIIVSLEQVYLIWCSVPSRVRSIWLYETTKPSNLK